MTTAAQHAATADRLAAELRAARCCDALDPCSCCRGRTRAARIYRRLARVAQA